MLSRDEQADTFERHAAIVHDKLRDHFTGGRNEPKDIRLKSVKYYAEPDVGVIEVDVNRLYRVPPEKMADDTFVHTLSTVVSADARRRVPVTALNTKGLRYVIWYSTPDTGGQPLGTSYILDSPRVRPNSARPYLVPLGVKADALRQEWVSLPKLISVLIGGESGQGKTNLLYSWLICLLEQHTPDTLELTLVDSKTTSLRRFGGWPHVKRHSFGPDALAAWRVLESVEEEMRERQRLFDGVTPLPDNLAEYNRHAGTRLPLHVFVVDEFTDFAVGLGERDFREMMKRLIQIASVARSTGIVPILSTQRPRADVVDTLARDNLRTRIALTTKQSQYNVILGHEWKADALPEHDGKPGRAVVVRPGVRDAKLYQTLLVPDRLRDKYSSLPSEDGQAVKPVRTPLSEAEARLVLDKQPEGVITRSDIQEALMRGDEHQARKLYDTWKHKGYIKSKRGVGGVIQDSLVEAANATLESLVR